MSEKIDYGHEAKKMLEMFETCVRALMASVSLIRKYLRLNGYDDEQIARCLDRAWKYSLDNADVNFDDES
jgi:hypothetical protein